MLSVLFNKRARRTICYRQKHTVTQQSHTDTCLTGRHIQIHSRYTERYTADSHRYTADKQDTQRYREDRQGTQKYKHTLRDLGMQELHTATGTDTRIDTQDSLLQASTDSDSCTRQRREDTGA